MQTRSRALLILATLTIMAIGSLTLALMLGNIHVSPKELVSVLFGNGNDLAREVVLKLRLPRALAGLGCGGLLAVSGALLQVLLRNPLADPYVLGISGGASVGALLVMLFGVAGGIGVSSAAFLGAFCTMFIVFGLAHGDGSWTQARLLLTGVIVAAGCGAAVALMLSIAPDHKLHGMLFWLMGDLSQSGNPTLILGALVLVVLIALPFARELNLLARGSDIAQSLGVAIKRLRFAIYVLASLATASAVTQAGSIGFVGLIVPHLVRLAIGNDQRVLLPASALAGGSLLVVADTLARTVIAPQQLPVGVLTALIGVPVFLFLLARDSQTGK
ncbi:FecCD family ABC transporter permease [Propionivibrio dicarboxylicus]|uniref:Iron complex transport system permease protein n=1 Tax=Propionivibrio dicarboxylicus TaxID=83767 RepID=A0A1G8ENW7_9RHOO|nr:iron ABC transporter permease [Propionivibrio dicarboxylicus]SDH71389.1 iron complex transport system permease protein [Propionivibrio dicarboxylicus]